MTTSSRARQERIELRTTPAVRRLLERAVSACGTNLTEFAETNLVLAARRVLAERDRFELSADAAAEWAKINARRARNLPGLRKLIDRPSPFDE